MESIQSSGNQYFKRNITSDKTRRHINNLMLAIKAAAKRQATVTNEAITSIGDDA